MSLDCLFLYHRKRIFYIVCPQGTLSCLECLRYDFFLRSVFSCLWYARVIISKFFVCFHYYDESIRIKFPSYYTFDFQDSSVSLSSVEIPSTSPLVLVTLPLLLLRSHFSRPTKHLWRSGSTTNVTKNEILLCKLISGHKIHTKTYQVLNLLSFFPSSFLYFGGQCCGQRRTLNQSWFLQYRGFRLSRFPSVN